MPDLGPVRELVQALRPVTLWYSTVTAMTALVVWVQTGVAWAKWPEPFQWLFYGWLGVTAFVPLNIALNRAGGAVAETVLNWVERRSAAEAERARNKNQTPK